MTDLPTDAVMARVDAGLDGSVERLFDFLRIPSVSTDPAYKAEVERGAAWVAETLTQLGFEASVRPTAGKPMVIGHHPGPGGDAPHILYYGHYDVQPPDPVELWNSPPFEPVLADGPHGKRIVARGAVDDKGQVMTFIEAFRAWRDVHGTLPCRVTVMIEGEEEIGSPSLLPFLEANLDELRADACVVCDTGMWSIDQPAITYSLRGLAYLEVKIQGPDQDLHSGLYGGSAINPINVLARILGEMHDETGRIAIPGFYDDVIPLGENERAQWDALDFDEAGFLGQVGLEVAGGEQGFGALERQWARPTLDVNGIWGGYTDPGAKTVIAREAHAKLSCRLVAGQDPDRIMACVQDFIRAALPQGFTAEFQDHGRAPAVRVPTDSPYLQAGLSGLREVYGKDAYLIGTGGSIPAVGAIKSLLGMDSILLGFGLSDDRVHSPNEKFELTCFHNGIRSNAAVLGRMAGIRKG